MSFVPTKFRIATLTTLILMAAVGDQSPTRADTTQKRTAQGLLFDTPYLSAMKPAGILSYDFNHITQHSKVYGETFADKVIVRIEATDEAGTPAAVFMDVYTGKRQRNLGPFSKSNGNPVIMMFLERDVWQMKRRIGGSPAFFRNRIRKAFRESAEVRQIEISFDGRTIPAYEVSIRPFKNEPDERRFREYRTKIYRFIITDKVPGGFFEITAVIPKEHSDAEYLVEDQLRYKSTTP